MSSASAMCVRIRIAGPTKKSDDLRLDEVLIHSSYSNQSQLLMHLEKAVDVMEESEGR